MKRIAASSLALATGLSMLAGGVWASDTATVMVFDASGSMWNRMDGDITRIEVARDVMADFFASRDAEGPLAVIAYGHRERGNCADIEVVAELDRHDPAQLADRLRGLNPQGMTPLADSLALARAQIPPTAESADIILVTDGLENCDGDPCALAAEIADSGIDIRAHVVGFGMSGNEVESLACVPEQTGGMLFETNSGSELAQALTTVSEPEPQPADLTFRAVDARNGAALDTADWEIVETDSGESVASADGQGTIDAVLDAGSYQISATAPGFEGTLDLDAEDGMTGTQDVPLDKVLATLTLQGVAAETGEALSDVTWTLIDLETESAIEEEAQGEQTTLLLPAGDYMVQGRADELEGQEQVFATLDEDISLQVELAMDLPDVTISGPETATAGETVTLEWSDTIHPRDIISIVPMGADEGERGVWRRAGENSALELTAPAEPGLYEMRYTLDAGNRTLASAPIEIVEGSTSISGPETATAGETVTLEWSETIHPRDIISIVPMGADEGERGVWRRAGENSSLELTAPAEPGLYELRYTLDAGNRTLASAPIEIVEGSTSISGPETATAGETVTLEWSETIHPRDIIAIVPMGADEGERGVWRRAGENSALDLTAPAEPGLYEMRYTLDAGNRTLASAPIEIVEASVSVSGPETLRQGETLRITWSETIHPRDIIAIVPMDADEGVRGNRRRVGNSGTEMTFDAPEETGVYEARYILDAGDTLLDSHVFEVLDEHAALNDGVEITAPGTASPGESVTISWTGGSDSSDRRITLARSDQPIFSWIEAKRIEDESETSFTLPDDTGFYEFRYLDVSEQEVLSRTPIEVR